MVHSSSDVREQVIQGMWGIFEVFFDTMVVCTLTAFVVLSSGALSSGATGVSLVSEAFSHGLGGFAGEFVSLAVMLFAFSTILGWSFYGTKAAEYLFGSGFTIVYKVLFIIFIVVGATMSLELVWDIADTLNGLMAIPNLIGVLLLSGTVIGITTDYVDRIIKKKAGSAAPMLSAYEELNRQQAKDL
jgi:AGCS family alanine or glycine:cation symporter